MQLFHSLTLLNSERPKLYTILAFLNAIGLRKSQPQHFSNAAGITKKLQSFSSSLTDPGMGGYRYTGQALIQLLVDSSTVICWTSPFVILGVLGVFCRFYSIFDGKPC